MRVRRLGRVGVVVLALLLLASVSAAASGQTKTSSPGRILTLHARLNSTTNVDGDASRDTATAGDTLQAMIWVRNDSSQVRQVTVVARLDAPGTAHDQRFDTAMLLNPGQQVIVTRSLLTISGAMPRGTWRLSALATASGGDSVAVVGGVVVE